MDRAAQGAGRSDAVSAKPLDFPRPVRFGRDYWLRRCEGYRVDGSDGKIGSVESLSFGRRHDRPDALVVRAGLFRPQRTTVPVEDVETILPRQRRLVVRQGSM